MDILFTRLTGNLAVILIIAFLIGGSNLYAKLFISERNWKLITIAGLLGGAFGIYGNLTGIPYNGAVISVRDIGPILSGVTGGPAAGLLAGFIAGAHRLILGGTTAKACIIATCMIGIFSGLLSRERRERMNDPIMAFLLGALMEVFHLCVVLAVVKPFSVALDIVKTIAIPFVFVNAIGFMLLLLIMKYIDYQRDLAEERSRLQSELEVASVIQHSLLPVISESYPGRSEFEISASMEAAKVVGGDFYDFFFVEKDKLALVIADVSGKGVPAALFMAKAKMVLQNCIRDIPDLQEALHTANNVLCERNTAEMFLTAWIGVLDIKSGSIDYVCAGHNPPVVVSGDSVEFVRTRGGFVLAGIEDMRYKTHHLTLKEGDILFLYTDGVTEAEDDVQELYGEKRLEDCLSMSHPSDAAAVIRLVRDDVATFVKGTAQSDDMTMLSVKMNSAG